MDDSYEQPIANPPKIATAQLMEEDEQDEMDEEMGLDWSKLQIARPVIPKRGEKEFEPKAGGGSNLQIHVLDRARTAMFDALRTQRTISSKALSHAIWYPEIRRAHVTVARGIHFSTVGHSVPRPVQGEDGSVKIQKRLELLPEETMYLVERGSLFCWKESNVDLVKAGMGMLQGAPMTVQQVHSELIGLEDLTLEKYQVYTYLKRLGYAVMRANPPSSHYPTSPQRKTTSAISRPSFLRRVLSVFPLLHSKLCRLFVGTFDWWKPLSISRWLHHDKNYAYIFRSLRFMSAGHKIPLYHPNPEKREIDKKSSPYRIFYNLYKPNTPFKKSDPPQPDFQVVVVNARTTPMPTLQELTDLFGESPELQLLPRQRRPAPNASSITATLGGKPQPSAPPIPSSHIATHQPPHPSFIRQLFPWAFDQSRPETGFVSKPHPFMALKQGKKMVVVAVVDSGSISFFRFGQGAFTEWPMA